MAKETMRVVFVEQWNNQYLLDCPADKKQFSHAYKVKRLKNIREPAIGEYIWPPEFDALVAAGVNVEVMEIK